ncbi:MAG: hypothetical protein ACK5V3_16090, partial [Bdellovibrionales bacterium]
MFQEETSLKYKLFLLLLGFTWPASAGLLEPSLDLALPFYKSPESPFPSGQASRNKLLDSLISSSTDLQFRVQWNEQEHLVEHSSLLREIELSTQVVVKNTSSLRLLAEMESSSLAQMRPGQNLEVMSHRGPWMRVRMRDKVSSKNHVGYVLTSEVEPHFTDIRRYTSLTDLILKKQPYQNSKSVVVVNRLSQLDLLEIQNGWGLLKTQSQQGWAPMSEIIGRSDFATRAWNLMQKKWVNIHSRNGAQMTLLEKLEKRSLSEFSVFQSQKSIAIFQGTHPKIPKGARVEIKEALAKRWNLSRLSGHGEIWWATRLD